MRTVKVSLEKFDAAVRSKAGRSRFMPIPSLNGKFVFVGLEMPGGVWVSWPETIDQNPTNGLTKEEMDKYVETYGSIPDIFTPKPMSAAQTYVPKDHKQVIPTDIVKAREFLSTVMLGKDKDIPLFPIEMQDARVVHSLEQCSDEDIMEITKALIGGND